MSDNNSVPEPDVVEQLCPGLQREWYCEKQIIVYTVTVVTKTLAQDWSEAAFGVLEAWPEDKPYLVLNDLSVRGVALAYLVQVKYDVLNLGVNTIGQQRVENLIISRPRFRAYVGYVFGSTFSGNLGQVFADLDQRKKVNTLTEYKVFFSREQGYSWLARKT